MEPGPPGDRRKTECGAQSNMKGGKTECQCHQLLNDPHVAVGHGMAVRTGHCGGARWGFTLLQGEDRGL